MILPPSFCPIDCAWSASCMGVLWFLPAQVRYVLLKSRAKWLQYSINREIYEIRQKSLSSIFAYFVYFAVILLLWFSLGQVMLSSSDLFVAPICAYLHLFAVKYSKRLDRNSGHLHSGQSQMRLKQSNHRLSPGHHSIIHHPLPHPPVLPAASISKLTISPSHPTISPMAATQPPLEGKRLVIIGGTAGLGLSAATAFVTAGARVVCVGLPSEETDSVAAGLKPCVHMIGSDATNPETASNAIHGLYHVAGGSGRRWGDGPLHEISDDGWRKTMDLNLTSVFFSNRAAVRQFLAQKTGGSILNLVSVLAWSPSPKYFATQAYAAAKAAIIGLTQSCAALYASQGIRFNALAPGLVETRMAARAVSNAEIMAFIKTKQPLDGGRIGHASDLDTAAVYLLSDSSRFVTGQVLAVDGGWCVTEGQFPPKP